MAIVLLFLHLLVLCDSSVQLLFENRVALNSGLDGMSDAASAIISHEQTPANRVFCFLSLNVHFQKTSFQMISNFETINYR